MHGQAKAVQYVGVCLVRARVCMVLRAVQLRDSHRAADTQGCHCVTVDTAIRQA